MRWIIALLRLLIFGKPKYSDYVAGISERVFPMEGRDICFVILKHYVTMEDRFRVKNYRSFEVLPGMIIDQEARVGDWVLFPDPDGFYHKGKRMLYKKVLECKSGHIDVGTHIMHYGQYKTFVPEDGIYYENEDGETVFMKSFRCREKTYQDAFAKYIQESIKQRK